MTAVAGVHQRADRRMLLQMAVRQLVGRTAGFVYFQDNLQKRKIRPNDTLFVGRADLYSS